MKLYFCMSATLYVNFNASIHSFRRVHCSGHGEDREPEMETDTAAEVGQVLDAPEGEGRRAGRAGITQQPETSTRREVGQRCPRVPYPAGRGSAAQGAEQRAAEM